MSDLVTADVRDFASIQSQRSKSAIIMQVLSFTSSPGFTQNFCFLLGWGENFVFLTLTLHLVYSSRPVWNPEYTSSICVNLKRWYISISNKLIFDNMRELQNVQRWISTKHMNIYLLYNELARYILSKGTYHNLSISERSADDMKYESLKLKDRIRHTFMITLRVLW